MPPRDVAPAAPPPPRPARSGNSIAALATGVRQVARRLPQRQAPPSTAPSPNASRNPIFAAPGNNVPAITRPINQQVARAQQPVLQRTSVPYVPKLAQPTPAQRGAAVALVSRGLQRQGVTRQETQLISRGAAGPVAQANLNRAIGYGRTVMRRDIPTSIGRALGAPDLALGTGPFGLPQVYTARHAGSDFAASHVAQAKPGDMHTRIGFPGATIDLSPITGAIGHALAGNPISAFAKGVVALASTRPFSDHNVLTRSLNDLVTYPAAAIPTVYEGITHPGRLAGGIAQQVEHPAQTFSEHPLFAALLAHGAVSAVGRTAGAALRAVPSQTTRDLATTARAPLVLSGSQGGRLLQERHYSRSLIHKGAQVVADKRLRGAVYTDGRPMMVTRGGERVQAMRPSRAALLASRGHLVNRRADFIANRANAAERLAREQESRDALAARPPGRGLSQPAGRMRLLPRRAYRPERDVATLAMQGVIRTPETFHTDLSQERARLQDVYDARKAEMTPAERRTNRINARTIDRVLADPRALANAQGVVESGRALGRRSQQLTRMAVEQRILHPDAAERARLFPYAQAHMGAQPVEHADGRVTLRQGDGTFLSNDQITAHMRANDVNPQDVGFLTHRADLRGARAFHAQFRPGRRLNLDTYSRTGQAFAKGAVASDYGAAVEHLVRTRNVVANVRETDRLIHDAGIRRPDGQLFTWQEAEAYAKRAGRVSGEATNRLMHGEPDLVPIRAFPASYDAARTADIRDALQNPTAPGAAERLVEQGFMDRLRAPVSGPEAQARNVVLVPADLAARLQRHLEPTQSAARAFQAASGAFRTTVLPFSTKWLTGNVAEAVGRLVTAGVAPHDSLVGRKVLRELVSMDAHAGNAAKASLVGGLLYGARGLTNRRTLADVTRTGGAVARLPVVHELGGALGTYTHAIFTANRMFEQESQYAALGKYARQQMQELTGSWLRAIRAERGAVREAARGLRDTSTQHDAARYIDETLGQYTRFSPAMRHLVQTYTPFLPWYLNSMRFVFWTLPAHHPVKTAVLTQGEAAFEQDWRDQHKDAPPGDLKTAIPSGGGFVDVARYTPFGFPGPVAAGDVSQIASPILPQVQGTVNALSGHDPFGGDLKVPGGGKANAGQRVLAAANQLASGFVPALSLAQRLREGGRKPYATSTVIVPQTQPVKPGAHKYSAPDRILNPFRPVYVSQSRARAGHGGAPAGTPQGDLQKALQESYGSGGGAAAQAQQELQKALQEAYGH